MPPSVTSKLAGAVDRFRQRHPGWGSSYDKTSQRIPLPQHPETPGCPAAIDVSALRMHVHEDFLLEGFSTYQLPFMAGLLTVASDSVGVAGAGGVVVDLADDVGVAGLLCAAVLGCDVVAMRRSRDHATALGRAAAANGLRVDVGDRAGDRRLSDRLDDLDVTPRIMIAGQRDSAAVLRSGQRAIRAARPVLFVPMRGPGGGLDVRTRTMLKRLGYVGYPLRMTSTFTPRRRWEKRSGRHPYWMLTAEPVDDEFVDRYEWWMEELAAAVPRPWLTESASMRFMRAVDSGGIAHGSTWVTTEVRRMSASVGRSVADRLSSLRSRQSSS